MKKNGFFVFMVVFLSFFLWGAIIFSAYASQSANVTATIQISVCGNIIAEPGEDCDNTDWAGRTCSNLGYNGGTLACDISCSFDTTSCVTPIIDPTNVAPAEVPALFAAGHFIKPAPDLITAVSRLTSTSDITTVIPVTGGGHTVLILDNTVFNRVNNYLFDPTTLSASAPDVSSVAGFGAGTNVKGVVQWGIAGTTLYFDTPLTYTLFVGEELNGLTLNVYRSESLTSGWSTSGIVSPSSCTVASGLCVFRATRSSYFTAVYTIPPTPTPTGAPTATPTPGPTSSSSSTSSSQTSSSSSTELGTAATSQSVSSPMSVFEQIIYRAASLLPPAIREYYVDATGRIRMENIFTTVKTWVDAWKETLLAEIYGEKIEGGDDALAQNKVKCDINNDNICNLVDLSVLLFHVEK